MVTQCILWCIIWNAVDCIICNEIYVKYGTGMYFEVYSGLYNV